MGPMHLRYGPAIINAVSLGMAGRTSPRMTDFKSTFQMLMWAASLNSIRPTMSRIYTVQVRGVRWDDVVYVSPRSRYIDLARAFVEWAASIDVATDQEISLLQREAAITRLACWETVTFNELEARLVQVTWWFKVCGLFRSRMWFDL